MANNFDGAAAWAARNAQKNADFDGAAAWAEREKARDAEKKTYGETTQIIPRVSQRMLAGSSLFSNAMQSAIDNAPTVETPVKPSRSAQEITSELTNVQVDPRLLHQTAPSN